MGRPASALVESISRGALMVRLGAVAVTTVAVGLSSVEQRLLQTLVLALIAASTYLLLAAISAGRVGRRTVPVLIDSVVVAVSFLVIGPDHPVAIGAVTTCLLLGLWVPSVQGGVAAVTVCSGYLTGWILVDTDSGGRSDTTYILVLPAILFSIFILGGIVRRTADDQVRAQAALEEAICSAAQAEAQTRFARELHDSLAKSLQGMALGAAALPTLVESNPQAAKEGAELVAQAARQAVAETRALMVDMRTEEQRQPLADMVRQVVRSWEERTRRAAELSVDQAAEIQELPRRYELLAALAEALENVDRHAGSGVLARVSLTTGPEGVRLTVTDDGRGASEEELEAKRAAARFGITGMGERVAAVGGSMSWRSAPGQGTSVTFLLPERNLVEP